MYGDEILSHNNVLDKFCKLCKFYNYNQICTPILEHSEVFTKSLGISSDIVSKEMYNFVDQGSESLVLRPEGTAALARALFPIHFIRKIINSFILVQCLEEKDHNLGG